MLPSEKSCMWEEQIQNSNTMNSQVLESTVQEKDLGMMVTDSLKSSGITVTLRIRRQTESLQ